MKIFLPLSCLLAIVCADAPWSATPQGFNHHGNSQLYRPGLDANTGYTNTDTGYATTNTGYPRSEYGAPKPSNVYGADLTGPTDSYGAPKELSDTYGSPKTGFGQGYSPSKAYGAPGAKYLPSEGQSRQSLPNRALSQSYASPQSTYGTPSQDYGAPAKVSEAYSAPAVSQEYGAPRDLSQKYGAPQDLSQKYGAPQDLSQKYGALQDLSQKYGAPQDLSQKYSAPRDLSQKYGAPRDLSQKYGAPRDLSQKYGAPQDLSQKYGAPQDLAQKYGAPSDLSQKYGAPQPLSQKYGAPQGLSQKYGAPRDFVAPSRLTDKYTAPNQGYSRANYQNPSDSYGTPVEYSNLSQEFDSPANSISDNSYSRQETASPKVPSNFYGVPKAFAPSKKYGAPNAEAKSLGYAGGFAPPSEGYAKEMPAERYGAPGYNAPSQGYNYGRNSLDEDQEPARYDFSYQVSDAESGSDFGHSETREDARAQGSYFVVLPDGSKQTVEYEADERGFKPKISVEPARGYDENASDGAFAGPRGPY